MNIGFPFKRIVCYFSQEQKTDKGIVREEFSFKILKVQSHVRKC
jgi:hypothetical protein